MKQLFIVILCLMVLSPVLAQDDVSEMDSMWECPGNFAGETLNVFNWDIYIADNTIPDFEDACDVDVIYDVFDSEDEVLDVLQQGNPARYDIVIPTGAVISELIDQELVVPLDVEQIPNIENVSEELLDPPYDPGNLYSLPYQWGTFAIGYQTEVFPDGITSWNQIWDYEGNVGWLDDSRRVLGLALLTLGYDPNTTDTAEIIEARDFLGSKGGDNLTIYPDSEGQVALVNGDVDLILEWSGDIIDLIYECECDDFAYVIPDEGANIWIDNMAIPQGAQNVELAHVFINYILDPQVNADISNFTAYSSPNQVAIDTGLIDEALLNDPGIYPSDETREELFFVLDLGSETNLVYRNAWDELLLFFGS